MHSDPSSGELRAFRKGFYISVNSLFGLIPSFAFFAWIERNGALPHAVAMPPLISPWLTSPVWVRAAWDFSLFIIFGVIHSGLAQTGAQRFLLRWVSAQGIRSTYLAVTGLSLLALMGLWQSLGIVLWVLPLSPTAINVLSLLAFWGILALSHVALTEIDLSEFLGFKQTFATNEEIKRTEGTPKLVRSGVYGIVRHPMYLFTLLAVALTPFMTLDRALVLFSMVFYLGFGIPIEERKLVALFGEDYLRYRREVPAIIPRWPRRLRWTSPRIPLQ